jgi:hypothetical protein
LTGPEDEEEAAEHRTILSDALKGLEATRKYKCKFDTDIFIKMNLHCMVEKKGVNRYVPHLPVYPRLRWDNILEQIMTPSFLILSIHQLSVCP